MSLIVWALSAWAQSPANTWKVMETEHYRVHYPAQTEAWTRYQVDRMEATRARVVEEVGYAPDFKVQVVVQDPISEANGAVLPLGRSPRMMLWTTPPGADSVIGNYRNWGELLITHEDAHVVHLMRPPRALSGQIMLSLFGLSPITIKAPRWVIEGYATVVEGRLTGSGRPHGALRGTLLRRLAQQGSLPPYGALDGSTRWQGYGYAYLVGSAYLEWLEERSGNPDALRNLWARLTARRVRDFSTAFEGVFGDKPHVLYRRFCAEVTADAMQADGHEWDRSTLWMDSSYSTAGPAVSPDGSKLVTVLRPPDGPARLHALETQVDEKAIERRAERIEELLERDPADVAPVDPRHPPHKAIASLAHRTLSPRNPRWLDEETVLFDASLMDGEGRIRRDLFTWSTKTGRVRRITRNEDLRDADPHDDFAIALQTRFGNSRLVKVDLSSGEVSPITDWSAEVVLDAPKISPDGSEVLYLEHTGAGFLPVVRDLTSGDTRPVALPEGATAIHAAWKGSDVVASLAYRGRIDLWQLGETSGRLTQTGAAFAPEPTEDGVFFLEMQADGYEIHFQPDGPLLPAIDVPLGLTDTAPEVEVSPPDPVEVEIRKFGVGRLEPRILLGGMTGFGGSNFELGFRLGDIVGRNDWVALGSLGDAGGTTGGGIWWANRTLPAAVEIRAWAVQDGIGPPWVLGGHGSMGFDKKSHVFRVVGQLGVWGEGDLDGAARGDVFGELGAGWIDPRSRFLSLSGEVRGSLGQGAGVKRSLVEWETGFRLGRRVALTSDYVMGIAGGEPFSLGGIRSGVRSEAAQWRQLRLGWLPPGTVIGTVHDRMSWSLDLYGFDFFVDRQRVWSGIGETAHSLAGIRVVQNAEHQSLVRIPGLSYEVGIGCQFETFSQVRERPCTQLDHLRTWSGVIWRP